ncbi:MAG: anti-sigma-I factor RsgI family protein [Tumebacillaceae bacterium]
MQKKGIVMQVANGQAIVMTKECEFRKIPLLDGMAVGQEVDVPEQTTQSVRKKPLAWFGTPLRKTGVLAASLLLAVGLWGSQSLFAPESAYAYVTVDINPSVEFAIDSQQHVMQVIGLNDDGKQVLTDVQVKGKTLNQAVESLTDSAKKKGFFSKNTEVIITASPAVSDDKLASDHIDLDKIENDLVTQVKTAVTTTGSSVEVEGIRVSPEVRSAAQKAGVSPGKYAVYLNAQSNGIDVSLDELKNHSITKVAGDHGEELSKVVQSLEGGAKLDHLLEAFTKDGKVKTQSQHPAIVQPSKQEDHPGNSSQAPGQQKKTDDSNAKHTQGNSKDTDNSKKPDDRSSDREHSDSGKSDHGSSHKSDDHDRSNNQSNKDQKGSDDHNRGNDDRGNNDHGNSGHDDNHGHGGGH